MRTLLARVAMLLGVAALLGVGWWLLAPRGLAWIVWTVGGVVGAWVVLEVVLQARRRGDERSASVRWRRAVIDPATRPDALRDLKRRLDHARRLGRRTRVRQARLATALAELELADDRADRAIATLAKVPVEDLEPLQAAVVRLARAQAYLHRSDADDAAATLSPLRAATGDAVIDASLKVLRGTIDHLEGRDAEAVEAAREVLAIAEPHDALWDEATALLALAEDDPRHLDALREEGRARLRALAPEAVRTWLRQPE